MPRRSERLLKRRFIDLCDTSESEAEPVLEFSGIYRVTYNCDGNSRGIASRKESFLTTDWKTVRYHFEKTFKKVYPSIAHIHNHYLDSGNSSLTECTRAMVINGKVIAELHSVSGLYEMMELCLQALTTECLGDGFQKVELYGGPGLVNVNGLGHFFRIDVITVEKCQNLIQTSGPVHGIDLIEC